MRRLAIILVVVLVAAACSGSPEVRPFSEVQASEFSFENDALSPGDGIFRVETTEPMICAIVWGETEELGNFNNSLSMAGTGIIAHDVVLPGAQPGQTYYFKVQGSTADGSLYSSELSTFTLPELDTTQAPEEPDRGDNLALGATIAGVSSEFGAAWAATNAIDGDLSTEWSSAGDGNDGFITIDLGAEAAVTGVEFLTRSMADGTATTSTYWLVVDGGERLGPFPAGNPADPAFQPLDFTGRLLTFEIDSSSGGNTGAIEIRVYGTGGSPSTTEPTTTTGDLTTTTEDM